MKLTVYSLVIQSLAVQLVSKQDRIESTIENTDQGGKQISIGKIAPQKLLQCELCEYAFENEITLLEPHGHKI